MSGNQWIGRREAEQTGFASSGCISWPVGGLSLSTCVLRSKTFCDHPCILCAIETIKSSLCVDCPVSDSEREPHKGSNMKGQKRCPTGFVLRSMPRLKPRNKKPRPCYSDSRRWASTILLLAEAEREGFTS